ncbi:phosphoglycolate phosphatase [Aliidiomarina quisquiliarum]|uniref:phosphoglycolate phosphatase n=1 Tax=Aliidiomarina quisquiliarum TaxID=2938947 RepID=UPI00208EAE73|nr:phosphoglycolate phosphatase [Aliidiomarina quisquiliarum]MCO4320863.1 phosphoglycolate phosphatase [Aliidiomarina quisquiliarum]
MPFTTKPCQAILFDLDGTLLDTAADLGLALNAMLAERNMPVLPHQVIRPLASHGSHGLLTAGFGNAYSAASSAQQSQLKAEFLTRYGENVCVATSWFEGVETLLEQLNSKGIVCGIVTNKPDQFTQPIVAAFPLLAQMPVVVSGDTLTVAKPRPEPLLYAAKQIQIAPEHCWYVGDAERDIIAGRAAGMTTFLAEWGYISTTDAPETWAADYHLAQPEQLLHSI